MSQFLPTSRAARLAGVSRGELQRRIRSGELPTFEGQIDVNDLIKAYPEINLTDDSMLEKVQNIKANARPKRRYEEAIPSAEVLVTRLKSVGVDLFHARTDVSRLEQLISEVKQHLATICARPDCDPKQEVQQLTAWLDTAFTEFSSGSRNTANLQMRDAMMRIMAAQIRLLPSGHEFFLEGQDSLLDASIRAGLYVNYGCSKGNCGACKARLVDGEVQKIREHDYILSEHERNMGYLLMCSNTAVTDVVLEAGEAESVSDIPHQSIRAGINKVEAPQDGLLLLHIQTPQTKTLRFMAGQDIRLTLDEGLSAVYPIASCPCDGRNLQILVRDRPDDAFAQRVFAGLELPEAINIEGPKGDFVLASDSADPLLLIAFEDGFAPIRSLSEHAISIDNAESIHLIRITEGTEPPFMDGLCRAWKDALDNFTYSHLGEGWDIARLLEAIRQQHPAPKNLAVYLAGPLSQQQPDIARLEELGILPAQVHLRLLDQ